MTTRRSPQRRIWYIPNGGSVACTLCCGRRLRRFLCIPVVGRIVVVYSAVVGRIVVVLSVIVLLRCRRGGVVCLL